MVGLACALLAGCGGTGARPPARTTPRAPAYVAEGDAICASQLPLLHRLRHPATPAQAIAFLPSALEVMRHDTTALRTLEAPAGARAELAAALSATGQLDALLTRVLHELRYGTMSLAELAAVQRRSVALHARLDARFRQAGLLRCAA